VSFLHGARSFYRRLPKGIAVVFLSIVVLAVGASIANQILGFVQSWEYLTGLSKTHPDIARFILVHPSAVILAAGVLGLLMIFLWAAFHHEAPSAPSTAEPQVAEQQESTHQTAPTVVPIIPAAADKRLARLEAAEAEIATATERFCETKSSPVTATFIEDGDTLFLRITNPGPSAQFRAIVRFEDTVELLRPQGLVYGVWNQRSSPDVELLRGESLDLVAAERRPYSKGDLITHYFQWHFPYYDGTERKEVVTANYFARNYSAEIWQDKWERLSDDLEMTLRLDLLSKMLAEPLVKTVNFKGASWNDPSIPFRSDGSQESIERLKESYPIICRSVTYALEYVTDDLFLPAQANAAHAMLVDMLQRYIAGPCLEAKERLDFDLSIPAPVNSLVTRLQTLLRRYGVLVDSIKRTAGIVFGDQAYQSEGFAGLYKRHAACVEELRRLGRRSEWGVIVASTDQLSQILAEMPTPSKSEPA